MQGYEPFLAGVVPIVVTAVESDEVGGRLFGTAGVVLFTPSLFTLEVDASEVFLSVETLLVSCGAPWKERLMSYLRA